MASSDSSTPIVSSQSLIPYGFACLENARETAPKYFCFGIADLEEIRTGVNLDHHRFNLHDGLFLHDFLPLLSWWIELARNLANGQAWEYSPDPKADPIIGEYTKKVSGLVREILSLYPAALDSTPDFAGIDRPQEEVQGLEMLGQYRELTICVRDFATMLWRNYDIDWLWGQR